jgi:hypothetical protein
MAPMADRPGSDRFDGHRHADLGTVVEVEAAAHLLQAELRAGHQPADRPDPRGTRDEPRVVHRPAPKFLDLEGTANSKRLEVYQPILTNEHLQRIRSIGDVADNEFRSLTIDITYDADRGEDGMEAALDVVCAEAEEAVLSGECNIIILSDRLIASDRIPIPSLLATSAVHHHLIRQGLRTRSVWSSRPAKPMRSTSSHARRLWRRGDQPLSRIRDVDAMRADFESELSSEEAARRYIKAINKGLLKVMSKMGISTYQSYCGAQIFDAVGLSTKFVEKYFTGRIRRLKASACPRSRARRSSGTALRSAMSPFSRTRWTSAASMPSAFVVKRTLGAEYGRRPAARRARQRRRQVSRLCQAW